MGQNFAFNSLLGVAVAVSLAGTASAADTPQRGGTMIIGNGDEPRVLAPDFSANVPDVMVGCMIYDGLVRFAPGFEIVPGLAKSWEISPDGLDYTFHLVDASWSDGEKLTSEDVKFTLTEISAKYGPKFIAAGKAIDHIDTPDPLTVKVHLKQTFGPFLFSLVCEQNSGIMPKHVFEGSDLLKNPALTEKPIGSGPFKFAEWQRGDHITVTRNDTHWKSGQPYLDKIIIKDIPDGSARILALQAGELDMIEEYYFPLNFYKLIASDPHFQLKEVGYGADDLITFNTKNKPFDNPAVRRALMVATDREYIHKNVDYSLGRIAVSSIDSRMKWALNPAVDYSKMYAYDPEKAKKMLDEAGFKLGADGTRFPVKLVFRPSRAEEAQIGADPAAQLAGGRRQGRDGPDRGRGLRAEGLRRVRFRRDDPQLLDRRRSRPRHLAHLHDRHDQQQGRLQQRLALLQPRGRRSLRQGPRRGEPGGAAGGLFQGPGADRPRPADAHHPRAGADRRRARRGRSTRSSPRITRGGAGSG